MIDASNLPKIAAVTAIVAFGVYRRVRRNIGRQILTAQRQYVRMGLFTVLCLVLTFLHPLQQGIILSLTPRRIGITSTAIF